MVKHIQHHLACLGGLALISISILVTSCNKTMDMEQQVDELYARMSPQERIAQLCSIYMDLLFDEDTRSDNKGAFEYDALEDNTYLFSFLDGDIARLIRFHDAIRNTKLHCKVIAYPEQISFLQSTTGSV